MANDLTKDIKFVTDAAEIYATSALLGKITWSEATSGGQLIIKDITGGKVLFQAKAGLNNDYIQFDFNGYPSKLRVTTIDSGTLLIHPYLPAR